MSSIKVSFLGGASAIGASSIFIEVADKSFLVDCGVRFKGSPLPDLSVLDGRKLDAILVTHAHSDHTGGLPVVSGMFPGTPIYTTPPTIDLISILQKDALKLMRLGDREQDYCYYTEEQVDRMISAFLPVRHMHRFSIGDIDITFVPASHILGASMIHLATPLGNILITGDYCVSPQATVPGLDRLGLPVDLIITETTYGERSHADRGAAENRLIATIASIIEGKGRVLVPAFAIGRAQEVLVILKRALRDGRLPEVPVFVDGMVRSVCDVYGRHEAYTSEFLAREIRKNRHPFYNDLIRPVASPEDRRHILAESPSIIVASSGMLSGGASAFYAQEVIQTSRDALLLTGYQDEESPGRTLLALTGTPQATSISEKPMLKLGTNVIPVLCRCEAYSLSAHADRGQIAGFLASARPKTVAFVHGDQQAKRSLAQVLSLGDLVNAEDGLTLSRRYSRRIVAVGKGEMNTAHEFDEALLTNFIAKFADDSWLDLTQVAKDWYGRMPSSPEITRLAEELEFYQLARRDDKLRSKLKRWITLSPDEQTLIDTNPKGQLWEYCAQQQLAMPLVEVEKIDSVWAAAISCEKRGFLLSSGPQHGRTKKVAEQMAARVLLVTLMDDTTAYRDLKEAPVRWVSTEEESQLKLENPKGKSLEWCMQRNFPELNVEKYPFDGGFRCRVIWPERLLAVTETLQERPWFAAKKSRSAEQAAYGWALKILLQWQDAQGNNEQSTDPGLSEENSSKDPRITLNEMRQKSLIKDFGYQDLKQSGPSHAPHFTVVAWAQVENSGKICVEPVQSRTKKEAQRLAAMKLVTKIIEVGF